MFAVPRNSHRLIQFPFVETTVISSLRKLKCTEEQLKENRELTKDLFNETKTTFFFFINRLLRGN